MKISIITSCYNRESTIRGAIDSVMSQDYPDIEYIIVDGSSTDKSLEIIKEMERLSKEAGFRSTHPGFEMKVISEPDGGMYEALNKGIRMATGDIIGLVHSDDFLYSGETVSHIAERFRESHADFLYGDGLFVNHERTGKVVRNWIGGKYRLWKVRHGWLPLHPTCYIRRSVMERKGLYNESYKIAADSDLLFRYLVGGDLSVTYLPEYIVRMRMGGLSTDSARRRQMWREDVRMYSSHGMNPVLMKIEKMLWKVPQFIEAKFK
ncbi:glycosyltransferase [Prevotella sp. PINT]|jgi:Glycosyltransferases, probably involved in cell wall biogenesis|uniref:glycosyltransferase family 2 protein n=1 Tax=Palleniella intestinalis TaxID=2736291 RepID=UPI001552DA5B|nr:glycosyltransferase family 2 protein [Palleniella intestinalis]NPD82430.1 glycosyltransferase [Palleniella intestinalis]